MATNQQDISFAEDQTLVVYLRSPVAGTSTYDAKSLDIQDKGIMVRYTTTLMSEAPVSAPDPVITTQYTVFVPWENVAGIRENHTI